MAALLFTTAAYACPKATVTGAYADLCRNLPHVSKDISHVEIHYADGRCSAGALP
jgi:hypothetical protein